MTLVYNGYGEDGMPSWIDTDKINQFEPNTPDWTDRQFEIAHPGWDTKSAPTTLTQAREIGLFGPALMNQPDADAFLGKMFASKGLNEQQAVAAAIQGNQAHLARFGQGYDTASSLSGIFNDFILPAAGVDGIQSLETLPGWSRDDAAARGKKAADIEHGGDFGSATGVGQILSYQSNLGGNIAEAWKQDPERALLGINTPAESAAWGAVTGKDYRATVDMTGGSTDYDTQSAQAKGIDTQSGEAMQQIAKMLAMRFGGGAVNGLFGEGGSTVAEGSTGNSTLVGDAGNDTLSGSGNMGDEFDPSLFSGGDNNDFFSGFDTSPSMPPAQTTDYFGGYNIDPNTGDVFYGTGDNPFGSNFSGGNTNDFFNGMNQVSPTMIQQAQAIAKQFGINPTTALQYVLKAAAGRVGLGGGAGGGGGGGLFGNSSLLDVAARTAPGIAALAYANMQPGIDVGPLQGILGQLGGNQDAIVKAATDPLQMNIAGGYGDILQSQAKRGIRGSSFGDTDIANYIATTGNSLANAGANAAEGSLALQGNLAGNIAQLKNQAQQIKNNLFGKAFDVLGRGLSPMPTLSVAGG